jgi:hypothetical protein
MCWETLTIGNGPWHSARWLASASAARYYRHARIAIGDVAKMISSAAAAVRDPLTATLVILLSDWLLSQFLFRLHPLGRAVVR